MRILIIEDDEILLEMLQNNLTHQHYIVDGVEDGQSGWEYAQASSYDLILMDVGLPNLDGIILCQRLRKQGCSTPILLMTAKGERENRIKGLDAGADDYLIKPLDLNELQARIRALLRRRTVTPTSILEAGKLCLDPCNCRVTYQDNPLKVTPKEYSLLELFLRNPLRVYSRSQIIDLIWNFDDPPLEESVKAHIKGLRKKLKPFSIHTWIENVYGIGYRFNPQIDSSLTNSAANEPEFEQKIGEMWQKYEGLMIQRLSVLQKAVKSSQNNHLTPELRQSAQKEAHKLAGVLGMFGKEDGSQLAQSIEDLLAASAVKQDKLSFLVEQLSKNLNLTLPLPIALDNALKLLLIDPDLQLGDSLQPLAKSESISLNQVQTLTEAQNLLLKDIPDAVILTIEKQSNLSESLTLLQELSKKNPPIPILVLTATEKLVDRLTIIRAGGKGLLVKPISSEQIWEQVKQILRRHRPLGVNVLIVDDDPAFLAILPPILEPWGIKVTSLDDPTRFWSVLPSVDPDLLILDVEMPEINGIELCQSIRTDPQWQSLPILFLTGHREAETIEQVFRVGADDYVTKPVTSSELVNRIINRLERTRLLQTLAQKDPITRLDNQSQSSSELQQLLSQSFVFAIFRLVDFSLLNFTYGHHIVNKILHRWGQLFQATFQGEEVIGYWGGGEFIVAIPGLNEQEAQEYLLEIQYLLRKQIFTDRVGKRFQVNYQSAIALYPNEGKSIQLLYQVVYSRLAEDN